MSNRDEEDLVWMKAAGISMGPGWGPEALLGIRRTNPGTDLPLGAVVVYELHGRRIAHRVVRRLAHEGTRSYLTQGDAFGQPDDLPVPGEAVIGVVVRVETPARTHQPNQPASRWFMWLRLRLATATLRRLRVRPRTRGQVSGKSKPSSSSG